MRFFAPILVLITLSSLLGCGGSGGSVNCSLKNPARLNTASSLSHKDVDLNEDPDQWPKFRRDRQNTGTIRLAATAYDSLARDDQERSGKWTFPRIDQPATQAFIAGPVINLSQSVVYIGSTDGIFYGLDLDTGAQVAGDPNETTDGNFAIFASPALPFATSAVVGVRDGVDAVFVGNGNSFLFGVNDKAVPQDKVWPNRLDGFIAASPTLGIDGTVYTSSLNTGLAGVCPNGALRFVRSTGSSESSPAVGRDPSDDDLDGTLYLGGDDRTLKAVAPRGVQLWVAAMSAPILAAPVVELDAAATTTQAIYAIDAAGAVGKFDRNGRRISAFRFERAAATESVNGSPAFARGRLYAAIDQSLVAIDATSGAVVWELSVGSRIQTSPAVALKAQDSSAPPIVVFGADDGTLYVVRDNGDDAATVGSFDTELGILSSPAIARDGTIVFGGQDGRVYAVD